MDTRKIEAVATDISLGRFLARARSCLRGELQNDPCRNLWTISVLLADLRKLSSFLLHPFGIFTIDYLQDSLRKLCGFKNRLLLPSALATDAQHLDSVGILVAVCPKWEDHMGYPSPKEETKLKPALKST